MGPSCESFQPPPRNNSVAVQENHITDGILQVAVAGTNKSQVDFMVNEGPVPAYPVLKGIKNCDDLGIGTTIIGHNHPSRGPNRIVHTLQAKRQERPAVVNGDENRYKNITPSTDLCEVRGSE